MTRAKHSAIRTPSQRILLPIDSVGAPCVESRLLRFDPQFDCIARVLVRLVTKTAGCTSMGGNRALFAPVVWRRGERWACPPAHTERHAAVELGWLPAMKHSGRSSRLPFSRMTQSLFDYVSH